MRDVGIYPRSQDGKGEACSCLIRVPRRLPTRRSKIYLSHFRFCRKEGNNFELFRINASSYPEMESPWNVNICSAKKKTAYRCYFFFKNSIVIADIIMLVSNVDVNTREYTREILILALCMIQ